MNTKDDSSARGVSVWSTMTPGERWLGIAIFAGAILLPPAVAFLRLIFG